MIRSGLTCSITVSCRSFLELGHGQCSSIVSSRWTQPGDYFLTTEMERKYLSHHVFTCSRLHRPAVFSKTMKLFPCFSARKFSTERHFVLFSSSISRHEKEADCIFYIDSRQRLISAGSWWSCLRIYVYCKFSIQPPEDGLFILKGVRLKFPCTVLVFLKF